MEPMKISVVVPVYNAGEYLSVCVQSILTQTYPHLELLLVDDGSNDGSRERCAAYTQEDSRVTLLCRERGGVSAARNAGIQAATGDYLMFLDNDDYWSHERVLEDVVGQLRESHADVLMFKSVLFWENGHRQENTRPIDRARIVGVPKAEALRYCIAQDVLTRAVWTKAIRRQLVTENGIRFPEGQRNEDTCFTGQLIRYAQTFDWYDTPSYMYRKGTGKSQSDQAVSYRITADLMEICEEFLTQVNRETDSDDLRAAYYAYMAYPFAVWMMYSSQVHDDRLKQDRRRMKALAYVLDYDDNPAVKKIRQMYHLCGFSLTCRALAFYQKLQKKKL